MLFTAKRVQTPEPPHATACTRMNCGVETWFDDSASRRDVAVRRKKGLALDPFQSSKALELFQTPFPTSTNLGEGGCKRPIAVATPRHPPVTPLSVALPVALFAALFAASLFVTFILGLFVTFVLALLAAFILASFVALILASFVASPLGLFVAFVLGLFVALILGLFGALMPRDDPKAIPVEIRPRL